MKEETTEQYIKRIRLSLPNCLMIVPDTIAYNTIKNNRPDLNLTIKGQGVEINEMVLIAIKRANK